MQGSGEHRAVGTSAQPFWSHPTVMLALFRRMKVFPLAVAAGFSGETTAVGPAVLQREQQREQQRS